MKKFICFISTVALAVNLASYTVTAEQTMVQGEFNGENICVEYGVLDNEWAVLNGYTDGKLAMSCKAEKTETGFSFAIAEENENMQMRIAFSSGEVLPLEMAKTPIQTEEPQITAEPEKEEQTLPTQTDKPETTKKEYPKAYEKPLDAFHAPAVVNDSQIAVIDGETYYVLSLIYLGEEITVNVRDSIVINSAPLKWQSLEGQSPSILKKGDVIHFLCDVMGRVKTIDLMFRPEFESYIANNEEFESLYNYDGYSKYYFGVPIEAKKGYVLIAGADGKTKEIELNSSVMVYTVEEGGKKPLCEFSGMGYNAISKTYIPKSNLDENDNVIWSDIEDETYALVRTVSGEATDVIVFVR